MNVYERNPEARRACIDHYGTSCAACGLRFEDMYVPVGVVTSTFITLSLS